MLAPLIASSPDMHGSAAAHFVNHIRILAQQKRLLGRNKVGRQQGFIPPALIDNPRAAALQAGDRVRQNGIGNGEIAGAVHMQRPHGDIGIESNAVNGGVVLGRSSDPGDGCAVTKLNIIGQSEAGAIIENHPPVTKRLMRVV